MNKPGKCVHFNGIQHERCEAGVSYDSIRDESQRPFRLPCFAAEGCATSCSSYREPTAEEIAADEAAFDAHLAMLNQRVAAGLCAHCGTKVAELEQVGKCVYAKPCGCRQGQGDAKRMRTAMGLTATSSPTT